MKFKSSCVIATALWLGLQGPLFAQQPGAWPIPLVNPAPTQAPAPNIAPVPPADNGHPNITQSADPGYVLQPNDYVQITVYQEDDLTTTTRVSPQGNIVLPLIGSIKVGGTTVADACAEIRAKLMAGYIRDPKITMTMIEFAKRRFSVLGQVQRPGSYEIPQQETVTLLDAIASAGGYTNIADPGKVTVRRKSNGKEEVYTLNAKEMARDSTHAAFTIEPGDIITVAETIF